MLNSELNSEPNNDQPDHSGLDESAAPESANQAQPDLSGPDAPHFQLPTGAEKEGGWEEVAEGRFMPRRVRGSCHGRALG